MWSLNFSLLSTCSSMPSHVDVSYDDLFGALKRYATCEQRLGKWRISPQRAEQKELNEREGMEGSVPLFMFTVQALETQRQQPAAAAALLHQGRPGVSLCVYVCDLYLCVCVRVSHPWITTRRKGRERCPADKPVTRRAWLAMWCKLTIIFFCNFPVSLDTLEWWQLVKVHWTLQKQHTVIGLAQRTRAPGEGMCF